MYHKFLRNRADESRQRADELRTEAQGCTDPVEQARYAEYINRLGEGAHKDNECANWVEDQETGGSEFGSWWF